MSIESPRDYEGMRAVSAVVAGTLRAVARELKPGVTTLELDAVARNVFMDCGARSGPQIDFGYPATICISVNEEAVHGLPGGRVVSRGDLVTIDVTAELDGYYADAAVSHAIRPCDSLALHLTAAAEAAFRAGASHARSGVPLWRVGQAVEREVKRRGFVVLRELCGHGIGRAVHEGPTVPNYADPAATERLQENQIIALEPIISSQANGTRVLADGWTLVTRDGSLAAHYEHTIMIRRGEPSILTAA
jgi:methionyl aminopeptidase